MKWRRRQEKRGAGWFLVILRVEYTRFVSCRRQSRQASRYKNCRVYPMDAVDTECSGAAQAANATDEKKGLEILQA